MAALAYLLLPVSGAIAYFGGTNARTRFHGLQAIVYGAAWVIVLYVCARLSDKATQAAFAAGAVGWMVLIVVAALGHDLRLPLVGKWLRHQAQVGPREPFEDRDSAATTDAA
ncbi:MAG: hypothetical protein M3290_01685 [Actinomycetota bacterium]|nr:hypothetical protein [Actinomycetota bacterium]